MNLLTNLSLTWCAVYFFFVIYHIRYWIVVRYSGITIITIRCIWLLGHDRHASLLKCVVNVNGLARQSIHNIADLAGLFYLNICISKVYSLQWQGCCRLLQFSIDWRWKCITNITITLTFTTTKALQQTACKGLAIYVSAECMHWALIIILKYTATHTCMPLYQKQAHYLLCTTCLSSPSIDRTSGPILNNIMLLAMC